MNTATYAVSQLNDSSLWSSIHPDHCLCGGSGWLLSAYDTWHACGRHKSAGHPEDYPSSPECHEPWEPMEPQAPSDEEMDHYGLSASERAEARRHYAEDMKRYKAEMARYEAELANFKANLPEYQAQYEAELDAREAESDRLYRENYTNAIAYFRAFCLNDGMAADEWDAAMADEDNVAAEGTLRAVCDGAHAIFWDKAQAAEERYAREQGYSGVSEMMYADAYHAEQFERGYYGY